MLVACIPAVFGLKTSLCSQFKQERCSIIISTDHYRVRDGVRRRIHKEYLDLVARFAESGDSEPIAVCWKDGQAFASDETLKVEILDSTKFGKEALTCQIRFGDRETELYLERRAGRPMSGVPGTLKWRVLVFGRALNNDAALNLLRNLHAMPSCNYKPISRCNPYPTYCVCPQCAS